MNPYPPTFLSLLAALPSTAKVLDVGAGGRRHPGVVGVEIVEHPNNSVQCDALALPFRDDTFDLIQCQAVLEHVVDPQLAVDEMTRVLRPGGIMYLEAAFMQPVHQEPHHYFNITPFGLAWLCRRLDADPVGFLGAPSEQFEWIFRDAGFEGILRPYEWSLLRKFLRSVDQGITPEGVARMASGVSIVARKPVGSPP